MVINAKVIKTKKKQIKKSKIFKKKLQIRKKYLHRYFVKHTIYIKLYIIYCLCIPLVWS